MNGLIRLVGNTLIRSAIYRGTRGASPVILIALGLIGAGLYLLAGK